MKDNKGEMSLRLTNIPVLNSHHEFKRYFELLLDEDFCNQFGFGRRVIVAPPFHWHGLQDELLTWILQRTILGFYREIRNPIFHGKQISGENPKVLIPPFELIQELYDWVDAWSTPTLKTLFQT